MSVKAYIISYSVAEVEPYQVLFIKSYRRVEYIYYLLITMQNTIKYAVLANFKRDPCIVLLNLFYTSRHI